MKYIKTYEKKENEKKICKQFLEIVSNKLSKNYNFVKAYNDSKHYKNYDEIIYVFDGIDNDKSDPNTTLQTILNFMNEIGWYDQNFQLIPMMENNKLYLCFGLSHSYNEMEELIMKNNAKKYNL